MTPKYLKVKYEEILEEISFDSCKQPSASQQNGSVCDVLRGGLPGGYSALKYIRRTLFFYKYLFRYFFFLFFKRMLREERE